jgi:tRNA modification GTPase
MNISTDDTIVALSTPPGEGGISIVRLSGSQALSLVQQVFTPAQPLPGGIQNRRVHYGHIVDGKRSIDEVLLLYLKSPHSYTREDVVEIQCHGGMVCSSRIVELLLSRGARMAHPGEFTRRAVLSGRISILQAEAVLSLIQAKTDRAMETAFEQLSGKTSLDLVRFRDDLLEIITSLEASIDFPDEGISALSDEALNDRLEMLQGGIELIIEASRRGSIYREGLRVAIVGKPNVGKSSLLNLLLGEERAIVNALPGTTRDAVQEWCDVRGIPVMLIDTAGIRETDDAVEKEGVRRTLDCIEKSDLLIALFDLSTPPTVEDHRIMEQLKRSGKPFFCALNKLDREDPVFSPDFQDFVGTSGPAKLSALDKTGFDAFLDLFERGALEGPVMTRESYAAATLRQMEKLIAVQNALTLARKALLDRFPHDLLLVDLRRALSLFGELMGECYDEAMLDTLFSRFCIGK